MRGIVPTATRTAVALACGLLAARGAAAGSLQTVSLEATLQQLAAGVDGRVGACAADSGGVACVNGDQRSSLQSVMKIVVALAVLDGVDQGRVRLDEPVTIHREDRSVGVQPLMDLVGKDGFKTTIDDLLRRAIVDSDCAATDVLLGRLGGPKAAQAILDRHGLSGVRVDRDERHLQTETLGLEWRPEYVDGAALDRAIQGLPENRREAAYRAYQNDARDTATPRGMVTLLQALSGGRLLSAASTRHLLEVMEQTATFPDRLKAGLSGGWRLGHKTGTSGTYKGLTVATNDVGVLTAPDGGRVSIAVFISDSRAAAPARAALMATIARAAIAAYR